MNQFQQAVHHSAAVKLALHADGRILPVAKAGENRLTLVTPTALPAGDAQIAMHVDGHTHFLSIVLPHGASPESPFVNVVHTPAAQPIA